MSLQQTRITFQESNLQFKTIDGYRMLLRENARALWSGDWEFFGFYEGMMSTITRGFNQAWAEGISKYNLKMDDLTVEERTRLSQEISHETMHIEGVADYIDSNSKANGGKLSTCMQRIEQWVAAYTRIKQLATAIAAKDKPLEWQYGDTVHCYDCLRLNGRVYRASIWVKYGLLPKSWNLECHGIHCQCKLVSTNKPLSRGRPPQLG